MLGWQGFSGFFWVLVVAKTRSAGIEVQGLRQGPFAAFGFSVRGVRSE